MCLDTSQRLRRPQHDLRRLQHAALLARTHAAPATATRPTTARPPSHVLLRTLTPLYVQPKHRAWTRAPSEGEDHAMGSSNPPQQAAPVPPALPLSPPHHTAASAFATVAQPAASRNRQYLRHCLAAHALTPRCRSHHALLARASARRKHLRRSLHALPSGVIGCRGRA